MPSIVETSIKKPLLIVVVFTIVALSGLICFSLLNRNLLPKFELAALTVQTIYPGAGASEVETSVTQKIEDALSTMENLHNISSTSLEGLSIVSIDLNEGADPNQGVQDAQRKINAIKSQLPTEIIDPSIEKYALDEKAILNLAALSSMPSTEFYKLVEDRIQPRLNKVPGVGAVRMTGGTKREIKVNIDAQKLQAYNLSILQALQAIQSANMEIPVGNVENTGAIYSVRLAAKYANLDELRQTVILSTPTMGEVKVADIADVEDGVAEQKLINRMDGRTAIGISVQKQADANGLQVADLTKAELAAIEKEYTADGVHFEIATDDSVYTKASVNSVITDLALAILIVALICFLFLHDLRSALIIMFSVPLSIIPSFIVLYILGYSLNMMSLMALSLVVGILVDDSIVVVEAIFHQLEMGKSKWEAALEGCRQIMATCLAITLVIVIAFVPLAIAGGLIGNMLKEFSIPILITVLCSFLVSFTVTPLMMSRFGKLSERTQLTLYARFSNLVENSFNSIKNAYIVILEVSLRHKTIVLLTATILFIGSIALLPAGFIGFAFMPEADKGEFTVNLDMNPQVTIYQNNQVTMQIEKIINSKPEVKRVYTNVGMSTNNSSKNNVSTIAVQLVDKKDRDMSVEKFAQQIKAEIMQAVPGVRAQTVVASTSGNTSEPIQLVVQGADIEQVQQTAAMVLDVIRRTPGTADAKYSIDDPRQEVQVKLDRAKMAKVGLSVADVGSTLRIAFAGNNDSKFRDGNFEYDIRIGIDNFDRSRPEDVSRLSLINRNGELIELNEIADISYGLGPSALERTDRISSITVKSNVVGRPVGTVGTEITTAIKGKAPDGVTIKPTGMMDLQSSAFGSLGFAFIAAIVLIYLIMVVLYDSLLDPVVVLFSIPLSLIGAFLALALTMNDLTIFSMIGLIVLIGLVAKNAILLVDFAKRMRFENKMDVYHALIEAGKVRLRPILMTTFAMIFGMLPIALASGNGAELKNGMAWVIIGGLSSSMLLTLVVVPVVYLAFNLSSGIRNVSVSTIQKSSSLV
ncbi:MAG: efflux RND transporter permease subunit [Tannerella sp.]|jgi:HAE1 family hydrophobic/amphiphilic exporter-1|nr:efflux RND transporter permease subunit [Tannerella sp.]